MNTPGHAAEVSPRRHLDRTLSKQRAPKGERRAPRISPAAALLLALTAFVTPSSTKAQAQLDPILTAMQAELTREQAALVLPGMQHPYFIEYRLDDVTSYEAVAAYGALTREEDSHQRIVRVTVRVGSFTADNSSARGDGTALLAPTDNNAEALRYALWIATDDAYKNALRQLSAKQASAKQFESQRKEADFTAAPAITHLEPLRTLALDRAAWCQHLVEASGLYASDPAVRAFSPEIQYSTASLRGVAVNRYLVNTEQTATRTGYTGYQASISVGAQAADGMRLGRDNGSTAVTAAELEPWPAFRRRVLDDLTSLHLLRAAPLVSADDYHGPVLFSGDAASDVFNRLFVPNIEADRPEPGTTARTTGAYNSSLHARVLPSFLNATDDPRMTTFADRHLLGAYDIDDEGVPAAPTDVVADGKLQNFLIGREPVRDFPQSNGHGRASVAQSAHPHSGVIVFRPVASTAPTAAQPKPPLFTDAEMNQQLLALAKEQKRDVYAVETLADLAPRMLFLVHPDGSRTLVRGAVFDELDNRSLRSSIVAAGGTPYINNSLGPIPQTTIAPSLLFDDIGVKRAVEEQQKLPYYPPPTAAH